MNRTTCPFAGGPSTATQETAQTGPHFLNSFKNGTSRGKKFWHGWATGQKILLPVAMLVDILAYQDLMRVRHCVRRTVRSSSKFVTYVLHHFGSPRPNIISRGNRTSGFSLIILVPVNPPRPRGTPGSLKPDIFSFIESSIRILEPVDASAQGSFG